MPNRYVIQLGIGNALFTFEIPRVKTLTPNGRSTVTARRESTHVALYSNDELNYFLVIN